jgi:hypothetical protein
LQVLIVEFAGKIASITPLNWKKWIICIVIGFIRFERLIPEMAQLIGSSLLSCVLQFL